MLAQAVQVRTSDHPTKDYEQAEHCFRWRHLIEVQMKIVDTEAQPFHGGTEEDNALY